MVSLLRYDTVNEVVLDGFLDGVSIHLDVIKAFGCNVVGSLNSCCIIIFNWYWTFDEEMEDRKMQFSSLYKY